MTEAGPPGSATAAATLTLARTSCATGGRSGAEAGQALPGHRGIFTTTRRRPSARLIQICQRAGLSLAEIKNSAVRDRGEQDRPHREAKRAQIAQQVWQPSARPMIPRAYRKLRTRCDFRQFPDCRRSPARFRR